jgi:hypothetical protein
VPMYDLVCDNGHELIDVMAPVGQKPECPLCGSTTQTLWRGASTSVIDDSIPGGYIVKHGICNEDGTPRKYYSKSEMTAEAKRRGLRNQVEHLGSPGSDKSKHTVRWV